MTLDRLKPRETLSEGFLSIDMEALLRKLPARSFRSPHHWPVELVRSALIRGARRVEVTIHSGLVEVADDGPPIPVEELDRLLSVFDPGNPPLERQAAIADFETERGISILAAFAPNPREVRIRTGGRHEVLIFRRAQPPLVNRADKIPGTRITVSRRRSEPAREMEILADYCHHARADVFLNGKLVSRGSRADRILSTTLPSRDGASEGSVWIPLAGDVCRIWLLDHGIRVRQIVHPAEDGLIYEATVECPTDPPPGLNRNVSSIAFDLYRQLAKLHDTHDHLRERIEELAFLHFRRTGSMALVDLFSPFLTCQQKRLRLSEVRRLARQGTLTALRTDDDHTRFLTTSRTLLLTDRQWEFLAEHASVPLTTPLPAPRPDPWPVRLARWLSRRISNAVSNLGLVRPVADSELTSGERRLLETVSCELGSGRYVLPRTSPGKVFAIMSRHRGLVPGRIMDHEGRKVLAISRHHPLVARAAEALVRDPGNVRMILPLLARGSGNWR